MQPNKSIRRFSRQDFINRTVQKEDNTEASAIVRLKTLPKPTTKGSQDKKNSKSNKNTLKNFIIEHNKCPDELESEFIIKWDKQLKKYASSDGERIVKENVMSKEFLSSFLQKLNECDLLNPKDFLMLISISMIALFSILAIGFIALLIVFRSSSIISVMCWCCISASIIFTLLGAGLLVAAPNLQSWRLAKRKENLRRVVIETKRLFADLNLECVPSSEFSFFILRAKITQQLQSRKSINNRHEVLKEIKTAQYSSSEDSEKIEKRTMMKIDKGKVKENERINAYKEEPSELLEINADHHESKEQFERPDVSFFEHKEEMPRFGQKENQSPKTPPTKRELLMKQKLKNQRDIAPVHKNTPQPMKRGVEPVSPRVHNLRRLEYNDFDDKRWEDPFEAEPSKPTDFDYSRKPKQNPFRDDPSYSIYPQMVQLPEVMPSPDRSMNSSFSDHPRRKSINKTTVRVERGVEGRQHRSISGSHNNSPSPRQSMMINFMGDEKRHF